jgi:hypothetical protein
VRSVDIGRSVRASSVAELFWTDPDGAPDGRGVLALSWHGTPAVAFTYAFEAQARAVAAAPLVALTLSEQRSTSAPFEPLAVTGRPRLVEDLEGSLFTDELLVEELRRYPPARKFADSAMLRREHWWYLPRLIVVIDVQSVQPLPARSTADDHVLVVAHDGTLDVHVVRPHPQRPGAASPLALTMHDGAVPVAGRAAMVGQDASFPDLEQWASWCFRGTCENGLLSLTQPPPEVGLPGVPSLWQRARHQHAYGRACRAGIKRAERRQ